MEKLLKDIAGRLKPNIRIKLETSSQYIKLEGEWTVTLATEDNRYPYWLVWTGKSPSKILREVVSYLDGLIDQPHGTDKIPWKDWTIN